MQFAIERRGRARPVLLVLAVIALAFKWATMSAQAGESFQPVSNCQITDGAIVTALPPAGSTTRDGIVTTRVLDKAGRFTFEEILPINPTNDQVLLLTADPIYNSIAPNSKIGACRFYPSGPSSDGKCDHLYYESTVVDNGPVVRLSSAEINLRSIWLNFTIAWTALGSISVKRFAGERLAVRRNGTSNQESKLLVGRAPQSMVLSSLFPSNSSVALEFGFITSGHFYRQGVLCVPQDSRLK
jgi:hypothetical protein